MPLPQRVVSTTKWILLSVLSLVFLLGLSSFAILGTERGRLWLTDTALSVIARSTDINIAITQLETPSINHWKLAALTISQKEKTIIKATDVSLTWQPSRLWQRQLIVNSLHSSTLEVYFASNKLNQSDKASEATNTKLFDFNQLALAKLPEFQVDQVSIDNLITYQEKQGEQFHVLPNAILRGKASHLDSTSFQMEVSLQTVSDIPTYGNLAFEQTSNNSFLVEGSITEDAGGWLGQHLALPKDQLIDANFLAYLYTENTGVRIDLDSLNTPIAQYHLNANGDAFINEDFNQINLEALVVKLNDSTHKIQGQWNNGLINASLSLNQFPLDLLEPWNPNLKIGSIDGHVTIRGSHALPAVSLDARIISEYQSLPVNIDLKGSGNIQAAKFERIDGQWGNAKLSAKGSIDWTDADTNLHISAKHLNADILRQFKLRLPQKLQIDTTSFNAQLSGNIKNPDGIMHGFVKGNYAQLPFTLNTNFRKEQQLLSTNDTRIQVPEGETTLKGKVDLNNLHGEIILDAVSLPIQLLTTAGINLPSDIEANLDGQIRINGPLNRPDFLTHFALDGLYQDIPFRFEGRGQHLDNNTQIESLVVSTNNKTVLTVDGLVNKENIDLRLIAERLPTRLLSALGWHLQPGQFSANFHAHGDFLKPEIEGSLQYAASLRGYDSEGRAKDVSLEWDLEVLTQTDHYAFISQFTRDNLAPGNLLAKFSRHSYEKYLGARYAQQKTKVTVPLDATFTGNLNLQTIGFLFDPELHRLSGNMNLDLQTGGTLDEPKLSGGITLAKSRYEHPSTGILLEDISCSVKARQNLMQLDACKANDGDIGRYQLLGNIHLPYRDRPSEIDVTIQTENANILRRPELDGETTGKINLAGNLKSLLLSGALEISPLTANIDAYTSSGIPKIRVKKIQSLDETEAKNNENKRPLESNVNLDIILNSSQQAFLRGRGLEAELAGKISLKGTLPNPRYEGEFNTIRGVFKVFGKTFNLERGEVSFSNNAVVLNIEGVYSKNGQRIIAQLSGSAESLAINLSAQPSMPEDEILAFIIFGKDINAISPFEAIQLVSAVQTLRGNSGSFDPISQTRKLLGADTLAIETETTEDGESGLNVGIGKYLNDKVYLELERTPNPSQPWKGNLQIELSPRIQLESSTGGQTGIEGAELRWKKDY